MVLSRSYTFFPCCFSDTIKKYIIDIVSIMYQVLLINIINAHHGYYSSIMDFINRCSQFSYRIRCFKMCVIQIQNRQ